jgi:hypothetical protein
MVQEYRELGFSDEVYSKVMGRNALRLMKMIDFLRSGHGAICRLPN